MNGRTNIDDGEWHHIAAVYDGERKYLFIDGQLDASVSATGNLKNSNIPVMIGANGTTLANGNSRSFNGAIANVRIWDWAVPIGDQNYYMGNKVTSNLARGHWTFDGSTEDFTSMNNNGILRGGASYESVSGESNTTSNEDAIDSSLPQNFVLEQNYPNPFNPSTTINYAIPIASNVSISVYNIMGKRITELINKPHNAGYHTVMFDAANLASGIYIYTIQAGNFSQTRKLTLIK
jgi:hypothetical protein